MNIWEILGIEKTTDLNEIKKAYAHRAKQWHPEEYPEEFQRLQKAYKMARAYANAGKENTRGRQSAFDQSAIGQSLPINLREEIGKEDSRQEKIKQEEIKPEVTQQQVIQESEPDYDYSGIEEEQSRWENQEQFWKTVSDMIRNPYKRNNTKLWKIYLNRTEVRALFHEQKFRYDFVVCICQADSTGWNRRPIQFLDKFLKQFESSSQEKVTMSEEWVSLKKTACSLKRSILKIVMKVIMTPLVWQVLVGIIVVSLLLLWSYWVQKEEKERRLRENVDEMMQGIMQEIEITYDREPETQSAEDMIQDLLEKMMPDR